MRFRLVASEGELLDKGTRRELGTEYLVEQLVVHRDVAQDAYQEPKETVQAAYDGVEPVLDGEEMVVLCIHQNLSSFIVDAERSKLVLGEFTTWQKRTLH